MATNSVFFTYPHYETRVHDKSIYEANYAEFLPLHRPIFFGRSQMGLPGIPMWIGDTNYGKKNLGEGTFDKYSEYYSREAVYLQYCLERQGAFWVRMLSDEAKYSSRLLSIHVVAANIQQYEKDEYGQFVLDGDGEKIPLLDANDDPITKPGYKVKWMASTIDNDQDIKTINPTTVVANGITTQIFPIIAVRALTPGKYGDSLGYKLHFDADMMDSEQIERIKALTYMFYPVSKTYGQDTVSPIRTSYGDPYSLVAMRADAIDKNLDKNYSMNKVLDENYWSNSYQASNLPYSVHVYSNYINTVSASVLAAENESGITEPYHIDIFTGQTKDGTPLDCLIIEFDDANANNVQINKNYIIYLAGGDDGDITDTNIETLTRQYLKDDIYPELEDSARYPFTHMYDTGVLLETKKAMISYLGNRDDFKVILATQDCSRERMNTKDEDMSVGMALHSAALLQPESMVHGTMCCRCEIYQQAGPLNDDTRYEGFLPFTLNALIKRCKHQSKAYMDGTPKGLPLSRIDIYRVPKVNWFPCKADHKQDSWSIGLNYAQFYDRHRIHHPDIRTVYTYDTSVLSSAIFTDVVVYTKHIVRYNWAVHAGKELLFEILADQAKKTTLNDLQNMLNGYCGVEVRFYRTEEEQKIGYITHSEIKLTGHAANRIWIADIECYRSGYNPEEA